MTLYLNRQTHFGEQLRKYRTRKGITQLQLAKLMNCHNSNISHFEKGDNTFGNGSLDTVFKYSQALGFDKIEITL